MHIKLKDIEHTAQRKQINCHYTHQKLLGWCQKVIFFSKSDHVIYQIKAAESVTFDLLILDLMFLFFKNIVKELKFRYPF